jgi:antitoxin (DNA-binding transcriptional repressor) of toxin-antitoxin stability system
MNTDLKDITNTTLMELVNKVKEGKEIILNENGIPIAKLVPFQERAVQKRKLGLLPDIEIADDFDEWPDDFKFPFGKSDS